MTLIMIAFALSLPVVLTTAWAGESVDVVKHPPTETTNSFYVGNRPPLLPLPLIKLPVGSIKPEGWLRRQLELQRDGFTGHLGEISSFLQKEKNAWLDPNGEGTHGWEEPPYWLKGYLNLVHLLSDEEGIAESEVWIEAALRSRQEDGWFGPDKGRKGAATRLEGREDLWPNMIMLFCLQDHYSVTSDRRVIELMSSYFKYLETVPEERFLVGYWPRMRGGDLLFSVYWLYNRTGEEYLLELAEKVHRRTADWTSGLINWHNVNISQAFGQPTTYYMQSRTRLHLEASYRNFDAIRELYGQVPGGMFGSDENCRRGFTGPRQAVETCGMVEMMLSTEQLVSITGDPLWADRCEDVAFNSLPAALTADLKALRYLTSPNMVLSDRNPKDPELQNGGPMLHMNPHDHRCCQHNWGHGWPYYAEHLFYATPDQGVAAVLYSDCRLEVEVGDGALVTIDENTHYPFDEQVELVVETPRSVEFPLYLRIPSWCADPKLEIDGRQVDVAAVPGRYIRIRRAWQGRQTVVLSLPMKISIREWSANHDSVSVDRGPLTYSLKIGETYLREGGTDEWPAWEIHPSTPWNYGLILEQSDPADSFEIVRRPWPVSDMPFTHEGAPLELRARGRRIAEWQLSGRGLVGKLQQSPVKSSQPVEEITLIPMGAARLRIASFPVIGEGDEAHSWQAPPEPAYIVKASHCFGSDSADAVADGLFPVDSADQSLPRFTWWDHQGGREWIQAEFGEKRTFSRVQVYWFDDTGAGACRVPASWQLMVRQGDQWLPVDDPSGYGVDRDVLNTTTFREVETDAMRLEVELQGGFSAGILEWVIE